MQWRGNEPVPLAEAFLKAATSQGKNCYFLTNTSLYGRLDIQAKLEKLMNYKIDESHVLDFY